MSDDEIKLRVFDPYVGWTARPLAEIGDPFDQLAGAQHRSPRRQGVWSPDFEIAKDAGRLIIRVDLPGVERDDISLEISGQELGVQAERSPSSARERVYRSERAYGKFYRTIKLPEYCQVERASAAFHNGVLEVSVPLNADHGEPARRIEIAMSHPGTPTTDAPPPQKKRT